MSDEETKIEPYYQMQAKQFVDCLFDAGRLSESLSRDGMKRIEDLLALMFQQQVNGAVRTSGLVKQYKKLGEDESARHEEEKRWIARAKEAEARVEAMEIIDQGLSLWHTGVIKLLMRLCGPPIPYCADAVELLQVATELHLVEPDLGPGRIIKPKGDEG